MRKKGKYFLALGMVLAAFVLAGDRPSVSVIPSVLAEGETEAAVTTEENTTEAPKKQVKNGWKKKKKKKYYYTNDEYVTGWQKIKKKEYYFNEKGVLQKDQMIA